MEHITIEQAEELAKVAKIRLHETNDLEIIHFDYPTESVMDIYDYPPDKGIDTIILRFGFEIPPLSPGTPQVFNRLRSQLDVVCKILKVLNISEGGDMDNDHEGIDWQWSLTPQSYKNLVKVFHAHNQVIYS